MSPPPAQPHHRVALAGGRLRLALLAAVVAATTLAPADVGARKRHRAHARATVHHHHVKRQRARLTRRIAHLPGWQTAERPPLTAGSAPAGSSGAGTPTPTAPGVTLPPDGAVLTPATQALGVAEHEDPYVTVLSRTTLRAGDVVVELHNTGADPHNLRITREDGTGTATQFPDTAPGVRVRRTVRLAAGRYRLLCTLQAPVSHDAAGMHATLTVT